jgi:hypothetical protein
MKKIVFLFLLLPHLACMTQDRVVEKSGRKPGWVNGLEKDYVIVVGTGGSVQDAQQNALNMVRENIVNAVAQNVKASSEMTIQESSLNNNLNIFFEKFATTVTTTSGPVPYLQGITLSKVDEYYWEKLQDRNTRSVSYVYHIKYPFPNMELQKLAMDFRIRDRELTEQLEEILSNIDKITTIEEIEKNIGELRILADYFIDARQEKARLGITRYRNLYNTIELVELESSSLGEIKYALRFGDRYVKATQRPQLTSECARITRTSMVDNYVVVNYDHANCYEDPENHILVRYRYGNNNIQKAFYFDITADKASIFLSEPVRIWAESEDGGNPTLDLTVVSRYDAPFTIDKIVLEIPGHSPINIENIRKTYKGKGNHSLIVNIQQAINAQALSTIDKTLPMLSGYIHFRSDRTGEAKTYRILNHSFNTNW